MTNKQRDAAFVALGRIEGTADNLEMYARRVRDGGTLAVTHDMLTACAAVLRQSKAALEAAVRATELSSW